MERAVSLGRLLRKSGLRKPVDLVVVTGAVHAGTL